MSAAVSITPASGSITAKSTVCRIDVTGADPTLTQRLKVTATGQTDLVGPSDFRPSSDGKHVWFNVVFPASGSWTVKLYDITTPSSSIATAAVTVS